MRRSYACSAREKVSSWWAYLTAVAHPSLLNNARVMLNAAMEIKTMTALSDRTIETAYLSSHAHLLKAYLQIRRFLWTFSTSSESYLKMTAQLFWIAASQDGSQVTKEKSWWWVRTICVSSTNRGREDQRDLLLLAKVNPEPISDAAPKWDNLRLAKQAVTKKNIPQTDWWCFDEIT